MSVRHSVKVTETLVNKGFWQVLHFGNEHTVNSRSTLDSAENWAEFVVNKLDML